jgi:hypothetical protein
VTFSRVIAKSQVAAKINAKYVWTPGLKCAPG